jgi:hypothetical protein
MDSYSKTSRERAMKVQEVLLRAMAKKITWWQAAEILGIGDRHMRAGEREANLEVARSRRTGHLVQIVGYDLKCRNKLCPCHYESSDDRSRRGRGGLNEDPVPLLLNELQPRFSSREMLSRVTLATL